MITTVSSVNWHATPGKMVTVWPVNYAIEARNQAKTA